MEDSRILLRQVNNLFTSFPEISAKGLLKPLGLEEDIFMDLGDCQPSDLRSGRFSRT